MRPALSIVLFTTLAGAGYGLWLVLGLALALNGDGTREACVALAIGFALTTLGLFASVAHLGQPLRAWRALSQWRSSWLSREGVASLACAVMAVLLGLAICIHASSITVRVLGAMVGVLSIVTLYCTAQIYASLPTIPAWHNALVFPVYAAIALVDGLASRWTIAAGFARAPSTALLAALAVAIAVATILKGVYFRHVDRSSLPSTLESATGLTNVGRATQFERPHTEANYLTREFGFDFARRHARRLRAAALVLIAAIPLVALVLASASDFRFAALLALASALIGTFLERWLFFAEARHVVMLYYGEPPRRK